MGGGGTTTTTSGQLDPTMVPLYRDSISRLLSLQGSNPVSAYSGPNPMQVQGLDPLQSWAGSMTPGLAQTSPLQALALQSMMQLPGMAMAGPTTGTPDYSQMPDISSLFSMMQPAQTQYAPTLQGQTPIMGPTPVVGGGVGGNGGGGGGGGDTGGDPNYIPLNPIRDSGGYIDYPRDDPNTPQREDQWPVGDDGQRVPRSPIQRQYQDSGGSPYDIGGDSYGMGGGTHAGSFGYPQHYTDPNTGPQLPYGPQPQGVGVAPPPPTPGAAPLAPTPGAAPPPSGGFFGGGPGLPAPAAGLRNEYQDLLAQYGVAGGFDPSTGFAQIQGLTPNPNAGYGRGAGNFSFSGHGAPAARADLQEHFAGQGMSTQEARSAANDITDAGRRAAQANWTDMSRTQESRANQQRIIDEARRRRQGGR